MHYILKLSILIIARSQLILGSVVRTLDDQHPINENCGGVLFNTVGTIRYKTNQAYNKHEKCVWTIRANFSYRIRLQLISDGFDTNSNDFVTIFGFTSSSWFTHLRTLGHLKAGDRRPVEADGPILFIMFKSDDLGTTGNGFELYFESESDNESNAQTQAFEDVYFTHLHLPSRFGSLTHPTFGGNYRRNEVLTIVVNPPEEFNSYFIKFTLEFVNGQCPSSDRLFIYSTIENGTDLLLNSHGGYCDVTEAINITADSTPYIIVFNSNNDMYQYQGFTFSWNLVEHPNHNNNGIDIGEL